MYKISVFLYPPLEHQEENFQQGWQKFMGLAEKMPKLRRETVSEVKRFLFGSNIHRYEKIHELYFDSQEDLDAALNSEAGQAAGAWLHEFAFGRFSLIVAEHEEALERDFAENAQKPQLEDAP